MTDADRSTDTIFSSFIGVIFFLKALALWADSFYKLKYPSVCPSVHLVVCLFTFEVPFKRPFDPTSQYPMSNMFRESESGKVMEISGLIFENFSLEVVLNL